MADHRPPYHPKATTTKRLPRAELAPISVAQALEPSPDSTPTLERCPACLDCESCGGVGRVSCTRCGDGTMSCEGCSDCVVCKGTRIRSRS